MFTRSHNKEEVKLWRIIFDLREELKNAHNLTDRYLIARNKVINMHQPNGGNKTTHQTYKVNETKCINCGQHYPCQTIQAIKL